MAETSKGFNMPLKSKKFVAYLVSELGWKILIGYIMFVYQNKIDHYAFMVLVTMVVTSGFIQIGYILGQAALDKYALVAQNALDKGQGGENDKKSEP